MAILELAGVSKHYGAIQALVDVSLVLEPGEVVGLMGDNGAGKSTLVKIIAGNFPPSGGRMSMLGREVAFHKPSDARREGIEIVYQDLALCDNLTAAENVYLGRELVFGFGPLRILKPTVESSSITRPASGRLNAASVCNSVDLPLPLRPSTAHISPGRNSIDSPSTSILPG